MMVGSSAGAGAGASSSSSSSSAYYVPQVVSDILMEISMISDIPMKLSRLDFYVHSLQQEIKKIHANFNPHLPFSMNLLQQAAERLEMEKEKQRTAREGFKQGRAESTFDMENTMNRSDDSSVQLRTTPIQYDESTILSLRSLSSGHNNNKTTRGAIMSFFNSEKIDQIVPPPIGLPFDGGSSFRHGAAAAAASQRKKVRRCWSPQLHNRFVNALQRLGGPNIATPKHIRALMDVEGLTNDQVKSHLQKYRIYVRKLPNSLASTNGYSWLRNVELSKNIELGSSFESRSRSPLEHLNLVKSSRDNSEDD
ncbi:transcription factor HHO5-like [Andrographis paniculata]|uniref:transcription factor HHO5-like n=1 Tax=Andrographis paniculata TaxID=175694 RepID=UPI0021E6F246|nr:transcription factor HHO5-like [Andrographis paniculata]